MEQDGVLPGSERPVHQGARCGDAYGGPVIGLVFAVFLPFIGIVMTLNLVGKKLVQGVESQRQAACPSGGGRSRRIWQAERPGSGEGEEGEKGSDKQ